MFWNEQFDSQSNAVVSVKFPTIIFITNLLFSLKNVEKRWRSQSES